MSCLSYLSLTPGDYLDLDGDEYIGLITNCPREIWGFAEVVTFISVGSEVSSFLPIKSETANVLPIRSELANVLPVQSEYANVLPLGSETKAIN